MTKNIASGIDWVGIFDFNITKFDIVMETKYGTTYNSYLIRDEKIALIESAKLKFFDTYLEKIKSLIDPSQIDYIIVDHTEPDHSGSVGKILELAPNATVVGSKQALNFLEQIIGTTFKQLVVKDGDVLSLGKKTLRFIDAKFLHWPDSIYTLAVEDKVLFTCDSFGAHYADENVFDDLADKKLWDDAFVYYYNCILRPFGKFFIEAIERIKDLDFNVVCPGHGPVLRKYYKERIAESRKLSEEYLTVLKKNRLFIAYVSAYGYSKEIAEAIAEGVKAAGDIDIDLCDIENMDFSTLASKIEQANGYLIGSCTINQNTLPQIYSVFAAMTPLRDKGKLAAAFGSYGWSGETIPIIESNLRALRFEVFEEHFSVRFRPLNEKLTHAFEFGKRFGEKFLSHNS
ncbi:MAG: FprA family A-type flavoprotein [Bacteroidales bacterium]|jgi:flavorubredoxin|nr:FprA family A-type flavoprotein [Bacteroidales bacterium]